MKKHIFNFISLFTFFCATVVMAEPSPCVLPEKLKKNEQIRYEERCDLNTLKISDQVFSLVPKKTPSLDDRLSRIYIAWPERGYIFEVSLDGEVFSILKSEPWKAKVKLKKFPLLVKNAIEQSSKIKKAGK